MKNKLLVLSALAACAAFAKGPVNVMDNHCLGLEYSGAFRGQMITSQNVLAYENIQLASLYFSPVEYVQFSLSLGVDKFETDEFGGKQFEGNFGFSPGAGLSLFTPGFVYNVLRLTGSANALYLNSKDEYHYRYSGPIVNPSIGLMIHPASILDIELGAMGHFIVGKMENTETNIEADFSNDQIMRGYLSLSLISSSGVWATLTASASPKVTQDWSAATKPVEASVGIAIGVLLRDDSVSKDNESSRYFPAYKEMREKQNKLKNELGN